MKKRLLLDVDEVICFTGFLPLINEFMNTNYVIDDFKDYFIDEIAIPKDRFEEFNNFINKRNLYENAYVLPHAIETIKILNEVYDIYICSSCINPFDIKGSGKLFLNKYNFLLKNLPFIKPEKYIFTSVKNLFIADIQIDDRLSNLDGNIETKILFSSYHNKEITDNELKNKGIIRAGYDWKDGWREVGNILLNDLENSDKPKIYNYHK